MKNTKPLKINVLANYFGQGYRVLIGIIIVPFYLKYLGAEAYGLVGFFALMQAWFYFLDMGLSPTLGRKIAYTRGRGNDFTSFRVLLRSIEVVFFVMAVLVAAIIIFFSGWIGNEWVNAEILSSQTIAYCISIMGGLVGLRFFASLYQSGINGMEDQVWLSAANITIASFRYIGVLALLHFVSNDIRKFFEYQLLVSLLEVAVFAGRFYGKLPDKTIGQRIKFSISSIRKIAPFALSIAYTAGIWVVIMNLDKLILSGILSLSEFGYFTIIGLAASGLIQLFAPVMQALLPRMTVLIAENKEKDMVVLYRTATQFISIVVLTAAFVMATYGNQLLYAWTGDLDVANWGHEVFFWFVLGNAIVALESFQYNLQNAYGNLSLHVKGSSISAVIQIPIIYFSATYYGALGVAIAWFWYRLFWFLSWTPVIHRKYYPGLHVKWLFIDILPIMAVGLVSVFIINQELDITNESRMNIAFNLVLIYLVLLVMTCIGSTRVMKRLMDMCSISAK